VLLACALQLTSAFYDEGSDVLALTSDNFEEAVMRADAVAMVEFYAPWCGHCQKLAPDYNKVAKSLKDIVVVGAVDCDAEPKLCSKFGVQSFPTLKLFPGERTRNPYTGEVTKLPQDYTGARSASGIAKALKAALPSHLDTIASEQDWEAFRGKTKEALPAVLLATTSTSTTPLYKSLALRFRSRLHFGEVHSNAAEGLPGLEVGSFPQLSVTLADGAVHVYPGELKAALIAEFLEQYAAPAPAEEAAAAPGGSKRGAQAYELPGLRALEAAQLSATLAEEERAVLVAFLGQAEEECGGAMGTLKAALREFSGMLPMYYIVLGSGVEGMEGLAADDGTLIQALREAPCTPKLALWPYGEDKEEEDPEVFTGDLADKQELQSFVHESFPNLVLRLNAQILQQYLGADLERPKMLLMTAKEQTPAMFRALAMNFHKDFGFAEIHKDDKESLASFPGTAKFPAMYLLAPQQDGQLGVIPIPPPLKYPNVYKFLSEIQIKPAEPGAAPPGALEPIASQQDFEARCVEAGGLCAIALLDGSNAEALEKKKAIVAKVAGKHAESPVRFVWMDGAAQHQFAAAFGARSTDLPTVLILSAHHRRYALLRGSFGESAIGALVDGVLSGKVKTVPLQELPEISEGGDAAVAADEEEVEEEFDLSDIMGEEVEEGAVTNEQRLREADEAVRREAEAAAKDAAAAAAQAKSAAASKKGKKSKKGKSKKKAAREEL